MIMAAAWIIVWGFLNSFFRYRFLREMLGEKHRYTYVWFYIGNLIYGQMNVRFMLAGTVRGNLLYLCGCGLVRRDRAVISPQGKANGLLANLMNQKELIEMNKTSLLKQALDKEQGIDAPGLKEKLEEYEEQLRSLDEQIVSEMAKQSEEGGVSGTALDTEGQTSIIENDGAPGDGENLEDINETMTELTDLSGELKKAQSVGSAYERREGEKRVCAAEIKLGSTAAKSRLEKIKKTEAVVGRFMGMLGNR